MPCLFAQSLAICFSLATFFILLYRFAEKKWPIKKAWQIIALFVVGLPSLITVMSMAVTWSCK